MSNEELSEKLAEAFDAGVAHGKKISAISEEPGVALVPFNPYRLKTGDVCPDDCVGQYHSEMEHNKPSEFKQCWATAGYKEHGKFGSKFAARCRLQDGHSVLRNGTGHDFPKEGGSE